MEIPGWSIKDGSTKRGWLVYFCTTVQIITRVNELSLPRLTCQSPDNYRGRADLHARPPSWSGAGGKVCARRAGLKHFGLSLSSARRAAFHKITLQKYLEKDMYLTAITSLGYFNYRLKQEEQMSSLALDKKWPVLMVGLFAFSLLAGLVLTCCYQGASSMPDICPSAGANCLTALGSVLLFSVLSLTLFLGPVFAFPFVPQLVYPFFRPPR